MKGVFGGFLSTVTLAFFAANPTSTNFTLKSYDFGTGGDSSTSTNFGLNSQTGEQSGDASSSTNFKINGGLQSAQGANVPAAPTFSNPPNEYNRLRLVIATASNPSDTKYQVAISSDAFATTSYVQTDNTIGSTNTISQYQTYASWGGASGVWIVGLAGNTTYQVKVRALQGNFSGSAYGPVATAATVSPTLTFTVATSLNSSPPFAVAFTSLPGGNVVNGNATADIGITTNSLNGGAVYIKGTGALTSISSGTSITSASADLSVASSGYGAQVSAASQVSGGPLSSNAPFDGTLSNVGALTSSLQSVISTGSSITGGTASIAFKAKSNVTTPSATDFADTITFIAAMLY